MAIINTCRRWCLHNNKTNSPARHSNQHIGYSNAEAENGLSDASIKMHLLVHAMMQKKNGMGFPIFPVDEVDYLDWRQNVNVWTENEGTLTKDAKKKQSLTLACEKHGRSHELTKGLSITDDSFETCLTQLNKR